MLKGVNPVAVKVLRDQSYTSRDEFSKEVALLKALHNSNIVQFQVRATFVLKERTCLIPLLPQSGRPGRSWHNHQASSYSTRAVIAHPHRRVRLQDHRCSRIKTLFAASSLLL